MGQYWKLVNLDKREYVHPHKLGCGLKLWEQLAGHPGTGAALIILCAAMPEARGGGDFCLDKRAGPPGGGYLEIAHRTIGRWAGDRIALVGDYAERSDLALEHKADCIYSLCQSEGDFQATVQSLHDRATAECAREALMLQAAGPLYTDISDDVAAVIEQELGGKFSGAGWRDFETTHSERGTDAEF